MKIWGKIAFLTIGIILFVVYSGPVRSEEPKEPDTTEIPVEMKEPPPERPVEPPGYFPGLIGPTTIGTIESGPVSGLISPYGNMAAYDTLLRGWRSRRLGKVILTPYLEFGGLYRSNIFLTPIDKKSDFIVNITPGLRAELPIARRHRLSLGYLGSGFSYTTYPKESHYDQNMNVDMALNPEGKMSLRFGNTLRLATEERNSEFAIRRRYLRNTPYLAAIYKLADRWKLEGNYQFDTLEFAKSADRINNYNQHTGGATLYYRVLPKTAVLAQYIFTFRTYPSFSPDNTVTHSPLVGLTWDPTAKLTGTIKFGYTFVNYETSVDGRNNSPENWTLSAQLLYRLSRYTNLSLTAQRSFQEDVDFFNAGYENTGVWVTLNHEWTRFKVFSYASFFYLNNAYINRAPDASGEFLTREDHIVGAGVGLNRALTRWLRIRLAYSYINRNSNFFGFSYNDHKFIAGLQTSF
jgi:hypothetical protein